MKRPEASWPRKIVHDAAFLFIPFAFAVFLLLLGGALLVTWGQLTNAVLVGFCVTAGILIGFFIICHLALYCTWTKEGTEKKKKKDDSGLSSHGSTLDARSVKFGSPRVCRSCLGGLSVHVPAAATFDGASGRLAPVIKENPDEVEPVRPNKPKTRPQQGQLAAENQRHDGEAVVSPSAGQNQQLHQDRVDDELGIRCLRPMSHLSATVPPLNLDQHQRNHAREFYSFQNPASAHPDSKGGPGILIQSRLEQVIHPGVVASSLMPAVLDTPSTIHASVQPDGYSRIDAQIRIPGSVPRSDSQDRNPLPYTPPARTAFIARQQAQQTAPKIGSPLRQSHQYLPYSPRDVGSPSPSRPRPHGPHQGERLPRIPIGDIAQRHADAGPATARESHRAMPDHEEGAQDTVGLFQPSTFETHLMRFREPDLLGLIANGVIKVNPQSHPPEWMLKYAPRFSSHKADIEILDNSERKTVELRQNVDSIRRNRSRRAEVESMGRSAGRRYSSNDSGYCTVSPGLLSTTSTICVKDMRQEESLRCKQLALSPAWGRGPSASSEGEKRILRRRSSVPELSSRFKREEQQEEHEADEGGSQGPSYEDYVWAEMGPLGILARVLETRRRLDMRSVSSIECSEAD